MNEVLPGPISLLGQQLNKVFPFWDLRDVSPMTVTWYDAWLILFAVIFHTVFRFKAQNYFRDYARRNGIKEDYKFAESSWKTIFYIFSFLWGTQLLLTGGWFPLELRIWQAKTDFWKRYPDIDLEPSLHFFYIFQLGFYLHSLYTHFLLETKRSDYWALFFHHLVTIWLIFFSYIMGWLRIGQVILWCHDTNDVFLEYGKTWVYREKDKIANTLFIGLIISWLITRLGIFPFMVIRSLLWEALDIVQPSLHFLQIPFAVLLLFLQALHIYWFYLILRLAFRVIFVSEASVEDIRDNQVIEKLAQEDGHANGTSSRKRSDKKTASK